MATTESLLPLYLLFTLAFRVVLCQISVASNIFDSLDNLGCKQFKEIILKGRLEDRFKNGAVPGTLFVFSDKAYEAKPANLVLYEDTQRGPRNYVKSFTLDQAIETTQFSNARPYESELNSKGYLFLDQRKNTRGGTASGTPGNTRYFVNGAIVVKGNIKAGSQIIHIIDRVLEMPKKSNAISYADDGNPKLTQFLFYTELMEPLSRTAMSDSEENYSNLVRKPLQADQVTFFLPTDEAIRKVPPDVLTQLRGNPVELLQVVMLHIVPNRVWYTSVVNHNEQIQSQHNSGSLRFRKNFDKEAVYVTATRRGGQTVTARIQPANMTVHNGVIHQVDQLLGFVYSSAIEEIKHDQDSNNFQQLINTARVDLKDSLTQQLLNIFVPTNNAMFAIGNVYQNYITNISLVNRVLSLSMLKPGPQFFLTSYNRGYRSMLLMESRYNGRMIKIYSEGNDTWVEGGYVRARVIKPDIGVTNGIMHQIDAVFGIPTRDIVYTIYCNDWLIRTHQQMKFVGLDGYMRDPDLVKNQVCSFRSGEIGSSAGEINRNNDQTFGEEVSNRLCGDSYRRCQFTFFVPNGTAIESFSQMPAGQKIMNDQQRWRYVLRRLISRRNVIYLDQLASDAPHRYIADNGDEVWIQITGHNSLPSGVRTTYISFDNVRAEVLRSDIGATNGVIHIIDNVLFVDDDLFRDVSVAANIHFQAATVVVFTLLSILL